MDFTPSDFNAVVQTVAGEGGNQPPEAQQAIASTVLNRHALTGRPIADIASDPSIYNGAQTANAQEAQLGSPTYQAIAKTIAPVFTNGPTTSATHFYAPAGMKNGAKPDFDNGTGTKIGDQIFLDRSDLLKPSSQSAAPDGALPTPDELRAGQQQKTAAAPASAQGALPTPDELRAAKGPTYDAAANVTRNPDGSIAGIGDIRPTIGPDGAVSINGSTDPQAISAWLAKHPDDQAAQLASKQAAAQAAAKQQSAESGANDLLSAAPIVGPFAASGLLPTLTHGVSQGFSDEASGALFAGMTGLKNAYLNATGQPIPFGMGDAFAAKTAAERNALNQAAQEHPIAATATEIGGSALPWLAAGPLGLLGRGAAAAPEATSAAGRLMQYGGRVLGGVRTGAVIGAPAGALNAFGNAQGSLSDRVPAAEGGALAGLVSGGALGGAVPAAEPLVARALPELGAAVGAMRQGGVNALRGLTGQNVETTLADYWRAKSPIAQGVANATTAPDVASLVEPTEHETRMAQTRVQQMLDAAGKHRDDLRAVPLDMPATTAEAIGSQTVNHAASLARRAGTTPDLAAAQMAGRAEQLGPDIMGYFKDASGLDPTTARVLNENTTAELHKDDVTPAYRAALDVDNPKPVMTPDLAKLRQDPDVSSALNAAARFVAKSGRPATVAGIKIDPDTGAQVLDPMTKQPIIEQQPTPETWDMAKKFVDKMIVRDPVTRQVVTSGPDGVKNVFLQQSAQDMKGALVNAIPGYDKALASASDELSRKAAFEQGTKTLFSNMPAADFKVLRAKMTPDELEAHTAGVANALFNKAQNGQLTPARLNTPLVKAKLSEVLGDNAQAFLDRVSQRLRLHATGNRIAPGAGSQTTPLAQAAQESAPVSALGNLAGEVAHAKASPFTFLAKHTINLVSGDTGANVAETPGYRNAYGRILLQHPRLTADELSNAPPIKPKLITAPKARASALAGYVGSTTQNNQ